MIILIGGDSHTGKTLLAQHIMERTKIPYTSLDLIKMGLVRGFPSCPFNAENNDEIIGDRMWGVVAGMIDTCAENQQNIILEGCYLPVKKVKHLFTKNLLAFYIGFSPEYIQNNYETIIRMENVIERRRYPEERTVADFVGSTLSLREQCRKLEMTYFEIETDYILEMQKICDWVCEKVHEDGQ